MEWEYNKKSVRHVKTGLTVHIDAGTFQLPYAIRVDGDGELDPVLSLRLVRKGIAFGAKHESSGTLLIDDTYEVYEKPVPKVIIKKRRRIPGRA